MTRILAPLGSAAHQEKYLEGAADNLLMDPFVEAGRDIAVGPWPSTDDDLLAGGDGWWLIACMDWPRDRWIGYVQGYWKAAEVIAQGVIDTDRDQDYLVYPFLMCWRHYVELQLKVIILLAQTYLRTPVAVPRTHKIHHLWRLARPLIEQVFPGEPTNDLDNTGRIILQLHGFDPTSEHFRYPILKDGSETLVSLGQIHIQNFHEVMDGIVGILDGTETGIRVMTDQRNEYESDMLDLYGRADNDAC